MDVQELQFEVLIDPAVPPVADQLVTFETGATRADRVRFAYEHHGPGFQSTDPGALTQFYEDLVMGAPMPLRMGIHGVKGPDTVVAVALFTFRELAVNPATAGFVAAVDLFHRYGTGGAAHMPSDVARLLRLLTMYYPAGLSKEATGERLTHGVQWVREYLVEDRLPHPGGKAPEVRVVNMGANGFVVAECDTPTPEAWVEVYRQGYLRGVLFGPDSGGRRAVSVARKSHFLTFDLGKAARLLNELERAEGEDPDWKATGHFLRAPETGTVLLPSMILDVLLRC